MNCCLENPGQIHGVDTKLLGMGFLEELPELGELAPPLESKPQRCSSAVSGDVV